LLVGVPLPSAMLSSASSCTDHCLNRSGLLGLPDLQVGVGGIFRRATWQRDFREGLVVEGRPIVVPEGPAP
jgi:hypothetical protein